MDALGAKYQHAQLGNHRIAEYPAVSYSVRNYLFYGR